MSQIRVNDIVNSAGTDAPGFSQGIDNTAVAKAWVFINGDASPFIRNSFNVSSITDNGVGNYTITWDIDFANDDYVTLITIEEVASGSSCSVGGLKDVVATYLVGSADTRIQNSNGTDIDVSLQAVAYGDQ